MSDDLVRSSLNALRQREAAIQARIEPLLAEQRQLRAAIEALKPLVEDAPPTVPNELTQSLAAPAKKDTGPRYVSVIKAAEQVDGISREAIRKAVRDGKITDTIKDPDQGYVLVSVDAVRAYVAQSKKTQRRPQQSPLGVRPPFELKYDLALVRDKAREMKVFNGRRLGKACGIPPESMFTYTSKLRAEGEIVRHGPARGQLVYFTHRDYKGEHDAEMARGLKPVPGGGGSATEARARDFVVKQRGPFTAMAMALALGIDKQVADGFLDRFGSKGMVATNTSVTPFEYEYMKPTDPGAAAKLAAPKNAATNGHGPDYGGTAAVSGTGKGVRAGEKLANQLIRDAKAAGAKVEPGSGSHMVAVLPNGRRVTFGGNIDSPGTLDAAYREMRAAGLRI